MVVDSRDRVTVDLRGLGPAVRAKAAARNLTLAAFARAAILEAMGHVDDQSLSLGPVGPADGQPVKLTLTLPLRQASWLVEHARASGVSYGTYLASLVDGAPYPGSLAEAVRALSASTDQMAAPVDRLPELPGADPRRQVCRSREVPRGGPVVLRRDPKAHEVDLCLGRRGAARRPVQADGGQSVLRKESRA